MMKEYGTILFDLDGTLTDSAEGILTCVRYALREMGFDDPPQMMRFVGPPLFESFETFCGMTHEQAVEAVRIYRVRYADKGLFENRPYEGVPEMLERLRAAGRRMAVATSKPEVFAVRILDKFGLSRYFETVGGAVIGGSDGERNEKREVIETVLGRMGVTDRSEVLMIGDRMHDIIGARQTGLDCMYALWGYGSAAEAREHRADFTAATPAECTDMILGR